MADNLLIIQKNIRADKQSTKIIRPSAKKIKKFVQSTVCMYIYVYIYIYISISIYIWMAVREKSISCGQDQEQGVGKINMLKVLESP